MDTGTDGVNMLPRDSLGSRRTVGTLNMAWPRIYEWLALRWWANHGPDHVMRRYGTAIIVSFAILNANPQRASPVAANHSVPFLDEYLVMLLNSDAPYHIMVRCRYLCHSRSAIELQYRVSSLSGHIGLQYSLCCNSFGPENRTGCFHNSWAHHKCWCLQNSF